MHGFTANIILASLRYFGQVKGLIYYPRSDGQPRIHTALCSITAMRMQVGLRTPLPDRVLYAIGSAQRHEQTERNPKQLDGTLNFVKMS